MGIKQTIEHNFSRHARRYDAYAAVQRVVGAHLIERLRSGSFVRILDIGCGTGDYTSLLHEKYPAAQVTGIDLSAGMIAEAKRKFGGGEIEFLVGDAETDPLATSFDLIASNACFHWFSDLNTTLAKCALALTENGCLAFSSQGPRTFWELADCLDTVLPAHPPISARTFADQRNLETTLRRHFPSVSVVEETLTETYPSLLALLNTIKYTGTRGSGLEGTTLTKTRLKQLEQTYIERIGTITATYQIFYCLAQRKESIRL